MLNSCPAKNVAAAQPNDPHILDFPYSNLYFRLTFSMYVSIAPMPAKNATPKYKPPIIAPINTLY